MNSITKRWVRGSLLITIVVLLLAETVFLYFTINNRYDAVRRAMQTCAQTLITQLSASDAH
ncbi:MAG: sensor histidine kinase, partial [Ruthenibacterium sp.]